MERYLEKNKIPKITKKKKIAFLETEDADHEDVQRSEQNQEKGRSEGIPLDISLSNEQKVALGAYWQRTKSVKRDRKQPIVESDSD